MRNRTGTARQENVGYRRGLMRMAALALPLIAVAIFAGCTDVPVDNTGTPDVVTQTPTQTIVRWRDSLVVRRDTIRIDSIIHDTIRVPTPTRRAKVEMLLTPYGDSVRIWMALDLNRLFFDYAVRLNGDGRPEALQLGVFAGLPGFEQAGYIGNREVQIVPQSVTLTLPMTELRPALNLPGYEEIELIHRPLTDWAGGMEFTGFARGLGRRVTVATGDEFPPSQTGERKSFAVIRNLKYNAGNRSITFVVEGSFGLLLEQGSSQVVMLPVHLKVELGV